MPGATEQANTCRVKNRNGLLISAITASSLRGEFPRECTCTAEREGERGIALNALADTIEGLVKMS